MAKRRVEIEFTVPASVSNPELREYLIEAIESSGGSRDPYDHLFRSIDVQRVKFIHANKPVTV